MRACVFIVSESGYADTLAGIYVINCQFYQAQSGNFQDLCTFQFYAVWFVIYIIIVQPAHVFIDTLDAVVVVCLYIIITLLN